MRKVSPRFIVGVFAGLRVAIGVAFLVAPDRLTGPSRESPGSTLMARSFAVREAVLGVGGMLAVARRDDSLSAVRTWAGLGALTDIGDLGAALVDINQGAQPALVPALMAATGLLVELWALAGPTHTRTTTEAI